MSGDDDKRGGHVVVGPPGDESLVVVRGECVDGVWQVRLGRTWLSATDARKVAAVLLWAAGGECG